MAINHPLLLNRKDQVMDVLTSGGFIQVITPPGDGSTLLTLFGPDRTQIEASRYALAACMPECTKCAQVRVPATGDTVRQWRPAAARSPGAGA